MSASGAVSTQAAFIDGRQGRLFRVRFVPRTGTVAGVVFVHAFAEEIAKSRHLVSSAARALAAGGVAVSALDLYGCADSEGTLGDARWDDWTADVAAEVRSLAAELGVPCHLWAMRSGSLTALAALRLLGDSGRAALLWQPVARGRLVVNEFLRLRAAASMMGGDRRETVDGLREELGAGGEIEVAGYTLGAGLAASLDAAELAGPLPAGTRIRWLDVTMTPERTLPPAARRLESALGAAGADVSVHRVQGPAFWSSGELQHCPGLVAVTVDAAQELSR